VHGYEKIYYESETKIGKRACQEDDDSLPRFFAPVTVRIAVFGQRIGIILTLHPDIAAKRYGAENPFGFSPLPTSQYRAESYAETLDFHSEKACGRKMAQLMEKNQNRQCSQRNRQIEDQRHETPSFFRQLYPKSMGKASVFFVTIVV